MSLTTTSVVSLTCSSLTVAPPKRDTQLGFSASASPTDLELTCCPSSVTRLLSTGFVIQAFFSQLLGCSLPALRLPPPKPRQNFKYLYPALRKQQPRRSTTANDEVSLREVFEHTFNPLPLAASQRQWSISPRSFCASTLRKEKERQGQRH